jgi:WD40 repeat protein
MKFTSFRVFIILIALLFSFQSFSQKPVLTLLNGPQGVVQALAVSPNGKFVVSGGQDNTLILWELSTGRIIRSFTEHKKMITSLAFLPDNNRFVSAANDGQVLLWDVQNAKVIKTFTGSRFALSSDGKTLATDNGNQLKIWNIATGKSTKTITAHAKNIYCLKYSNDGKSLITGAFDNTAKIFNATTYAETKSFAGHKDAVRSAWISGDGKFVFTSSADSVLKRWDAASKKELNSVKGLILGLINDKKQVLVASGLDFKDLALWDWTNWKEVKKITTDINFKAATFSSDGKNCVTASGYDGTSLNIWDATNWTKKGKLKAHSCPVLSVAISGDGKYAYTYRNSNTLTLWDLTSGKNLRIMGTFTQDLTDIIFAPDSRHCLARFADKSAKLFNLLTGSEVASFKGSAFQFSPDGKFLLAGTENGDFELWDLEKYKVSKTFSGHQYYASSFAFSIDGKYILSGSYDKTVRLWKAKSALESDCLNGHSGEISSVSFSPDAKFAQSVSYDGNVKVWNLDKGKEIKNFKGVRNFVKYMSLPYNTNSNFSNLGDKEFKIWDLNEPDKLKDFTGHNATVTAVTFSPDWKFALSGDYDGDVKFWDVDFAQVIKPLQSHKGTITSIRFSGNSLNAISGSLDNTAKIWDLQAGKEKLTLVGIDSTDWVVLTPDGRFDGSENGINQVFYTIGSTILPLPAISEKFKTPGLLAKVMNDEKLEIPSVDFAKGLKLPPEVKISVPAATKLAVNSVVTVTVEGMDKGGGVNEIRFWQNGKLIQPEQVKAKANPKNKNVVKSYKITLQAGNNELKAIGINDERTEGMPFILNLQAK